MKKSKIYNFSDDDFTKIIKESFSYRECCEKLGLSTNGSNGTIQIKKRCQELNISTSHFKLFGRNTSSNRKSLEEILVKDSTYTNNVRIKERLIREGLLTYQCALCGNKGKWNNKPLTLQLDHINGNHQDYRLENLRLLCPNCHSQTETFGSRQRRAKSIEKQ